MITGNEMRNLETSIMSAITEEIRDSAADGGSVNQACKDAIVKTGVHKYVYNVGNPPTVYIRRFEAGGLADEDNLYTTTSSGRNSVSIDIEDRTPEGSGGMINPPPDPVHYLSDIVESGANGPKWIDPDHPGPRVYMEPSLQDGCSSGGEIDNELNALLRGLVLNV